MSCKGLEEENCLPPNCKYIDGQKRKYCKTNTVNNTNTKKVSQCKGLAKNNCFQPCKYVDTQKRHYCRISGKKIVEKVENAKNTIRTFLTRAITNKRKIKSSGITRSSKNNISYPSVSDRQSVSDQQSVSDRQSISDHLSEPIIISSGRTMSEKKIKRSKQLEKVSKAKQTIGRFLYKNRENIKPII
jgi:hypothetical protein